jgi:hypothetical protein
MGKSFSGAAQTLELTTTFADEGRVSASIEGFDAGGGPSLTRTNLRQISDTHPFVVSFTGPVNDSGHGYLLVKQSTPAPIPTPVTALLKTDIRFFEFSHLTCEDETNPEAGSDDIYTQFVVDGQSRRGPGSGYVEFDCNDNEDPEDWRKILGLDHFAYTKSLIIRIREEDDSSGDDASKRFDLSPLGQDQSERKGIVEWTFDDGKYRLDYRLVRRRNEPGVTTWPP